MTPPRDNNIVTAPHTEWKWTSAWNLIQTSRLTTPHTAQESMKIFIMHIMRLTREATVAPKKVWNGLRFLRCLRGEGEWGLLCMARGLYDFNFPPGSSERVRRLSYQLAQIWGRKERGRSETQKLSSVKHKKDGGRLYIHTSLYNPIHWCRSGICDLFLSIEYD